MNQIEIKISNNEIKYNDAIMFMESRVKEINQNKSNELIWFLNHTNCFLEAQ